LPSILVWTFIISPSNFVALLIKFLVFTKFIPAIIKKIVDNKIVALCQVWWD